MQDDKILSNEQIRDRRVLLIDDQGTNRGEVDVRVAMNKAIEVGLDLVQVGIDARTTTPVCKILDLGKYKYEQSKKKQPKNHSEQVKEIVFKPRISDHDIEIKKKKTREMLEKSYKVRFGMKLKGREMEHQAQAKLVVKNHADTFSGIARHDGITVSDRFIFVVLSPLS